ncbi:MAG: hypothetical protein Q9207_008580, partial [Kuettlingeria erythrocarpa]
HLDLTGCTAWLPALAWREGGVEWSGAWSGVRTVVVAQGRPVPAALLQEQDGPWRALLAFDPAKQEGAMGMAEQARELRAWCKAEVEVIEEVVRRVRDGEQQPFRGPVPGVSWADIEAEWRDGRRTSGPRWVQHERPDGGRKGVGARVRFERGWDAWWIRECLGVYKGMMRQAGGR